MLLLLGSILLNTCIILSFKLLERYRINAFQAIVFNYITCVITGSVTEGGFPLHQGILQQPWFPWALLMGASFITTLNIIGLTTRKNGVAVTSVANKLSVVIPFGFSLYLYNEQAGWLKITGMVLALVAVYLTIKRKDNTPAHTINKWLWVFPVILFAASGLLDTLIKYVEQGYINDTNRNAYLITTFACAAGAGSLGLLASVLTGKQRFNYLSIAAGIIIGIPNYFSIWFLLAVLKEYTGNSSAIIPINNMGIVLLSAVAAWGLFRERLSFTNWIGIILSLGAIALIAYG
jgi:drug/metabolite transporter (DMT)-like permease